MDFTNLLKAIEEFLYELVAWVIFYPLTLFRVVTRPLQMMAYAERELGDALDGQYDDTMSPPIFLVVTILLAHLLQMALSPPIGGDLPAVFRDERNLLLFRSVALGLFPLLMAFQTVRLRKARMTRKSLQPAFYGQCFVAAPFILGAYLALTLSLHGGSALYWGSALAALTVVWYAVVQARWYFAVAGSWPRALSTTLATLVLGVVTVAAFTALSTLVAQRMSS